MWFNFFSYIFLLFDCPIASHLFFCVLTCSSNTRVLHGLSYFFYVLRFGLISQQRACVIQRFTSTFRLVLFFYCLYLFYFYQLFSFLVLIVADNGVIILLLNTVL
ncbi:hypothetical protein Hanom_Chr00s035164g01771811 [Helianthus anomalus]